MGTTSIYKLRWPERPDPADGPDGYMDLANDIDTQMIKFRQRTSVDGWRNPAIIVNPTSTYVRLLDLQLNPTVAGWVAVEYQVNIVGWSGGNHAGNVQVRLGPGTTPPVLRTQRYHNRARGVSWYVTGRVAASTLDLAPMRLQIDVSCDAASSNYVQVAFVPYSIQYYGGKPA